MPTEEYPRDMREVSYWKICWSCQGPDTAGNPCFCVRAALHNAQIVHSPIQSVKNLGVALEPNGAVQ